MRFAPHDLAALRDALERRGDELRREVQAAEIARRAPIDRTDVGDREDDALRLQVADIGAAEEDRDVAELRQVDAALRRLATGDYGECVDCGAPIGMLRLQLQPAAERCAACQGASERNAHRF